MSNIIVNVDDVTTNLASKIGQLSLDLAIASAQLKAAEAQIVELQKELMAAAEREEPQRLSEAGGSEVSE